MRKYFLKVIIVLLVIALGISFYTGSVYKNYKNMNMQDLMIEGLISTSIHEMSSHAGTTFGVDTYTIVDGRKEHVYIVLSDEIDSDAEALMAAHIITLSPVANNWKKIKVTIANPLKVTTYIWGQHEAHKTIIDYDKNH